MHGLTTGQTAIRLEASTVCQLACPICPTTLGTIKAQLGAGFLKFDAFRRIVDDNPSLCRIELSNWGEIFLNKDLDRIVEYAYRRSVALTAWNGVNLNHAREHVLESLARYRFRGLSCSIDGVSQETYVAYRREGDVQRVLENIRKLNAYKKKWKTQYPWLTWQMIAFRHNAHEVDAARALARELGMGFLLKTSSDPDFMPEPPDEASSPGPSGAPGTTRPPQGEDVAWHSCAQLWEEPQINFDGALLGCCVNTTSTFGPNVLDVGLARALADDRLDYAKRMLLGAAPARADIPCTSCHVYAERARTGTWVSRSTPPGIVPFLRRHGMGRTAVWVGNRFERPLAPARALARRLRRQTAPAGLDT